MRKISTMILLTLALIGTALATPQDAGDKMKAGVKKIGKGAKEMGGATVEGTKNVAKAARKKTVTGSKRVGRATVKGTKKGIKKVGEGTEKVGKTIKKAG